MKFARFVVTMILIICMVTLTCYADMPTSADTTNFLLPNIEFFNEEVYYHIDATTFEVEVETFEAETQKNDINNTVTEGNTYEYVPESLSNDPPAEVSPYILGGTWTKITNTTIGRYRNTVYLSFTTANGGTGRATGFFIGPSTVVTAGHVVHNETRLQNTGNALPTSMTVIPAYSNSTEGTMPYGSATVRSYIVSSIWVNERNYNYDWAIVRLNSNLGDSVGHYGLKWQSNSYNDTDIHAHGYPRFIGTSDNSFLYLTSGTISESFAKTLRSIDTSILEGMSGGPIYVYSSTYGYQAIGIISGSDRDETYNRFTRFDETLYNRLLEYTDLRV